MTWQIMPAYDSLEAARQQFAWELPEAYNPADDFLREHDPDRSALIYEEPDGSVSTHSYGDLDEQSDRLAAALDALGIEPGDRVAVVVPQKPANPITHLANWKLGAISVPLTVLFGPEALEYRLEDSGAKAVVVDPGVRETVEAVRESCPALNHVIELGESATEDAHAFEDLVDDHEPGINSYESTPETPSAIMYTSGSTGPPKGVLHSHALWLGRAAAAYNYFDQGVAGSTLWTPADWAWGAALGGTLCAGLHYGATVVAWPREGFDPEAVFEFLARHDVTHSFMPPTALRMLMDVDDPADRYDLSLEALAAAGEPLTPEILEWAAESFDDVPVNEFYGQTELNLVVGNSATWFEAQPESMGRPLPGYEVRVVDPDDPDPDEPLPRGEAGELAVKPDDRRVFFDEYWHLPEQTAEKEVDGWFLTGDIVERDAEGYCWFVSRADDVILTSGYRVGPMEVESVLLEHPTVEQAGVVGVPDETRGEAIKAFVQPTEAGSAALREELQTLVREQLAAYEYPREIEFVDTLPTTTTGKIQRRELRERSE
ncbi:acyl-CoA synthetase [Halohasta salina]|uniref:acyl-CoA synthetase n=1 Tax=Halohasta salina TaxID=2961621 RepID=UPI0020A33104|nr:AMP-binding protein [Halohasta salina]